MGLAELKNRVVQAVERVKFPAYGDGYSLYRNVAAPGIYLNLGLFAVNLANLVGGYTGIVPDEAREAIRNFAGPVADVMGWGILATASPRAYTALRERHNRLSFGESLTVSRVAVLPNNRITRAIPELKDERYYGEIHYIGKQLDINVRQAPDFRRVMRDGIVGLSQLVEACEQQDPQLDGINHFVGISPIVTEGLTRFGFQVTEPPHRRNYPIKDPADFLRQFLKVQPFGWLAHRESLMCIASREDLVANRAAIDRLAQRGAN